MLPSTRPVWRIIGFCLAGLSCLGALRIAGLQTATVPTEYQMKAAFIYKFATYIQWPSAAADAGKPFVIGILGTDPFGADFEAIVRGQTVNRRPVVITRFADVEQATRCDILFIGASERNKLRWILAKLHEAPVLTVGDLDQFAERGGMIHLTNEGKRIRFSINVAALERAKLKAASQLLRLATIVGDKPESR